MLSSMILISLSIVAFTSGVTCELSISADFARSFNTSGLLEVGIIARRDSEEKVVFDWRRAPPDVDSHASSARDAPTT